MQQYNGQFRHVTEGILSAMLGFGLVAKFLALPLKAVALVLRSVALVLFL